MNRGDGKTKRIRGRDHGVFLGERREQKNGAGGVREPQSPVNGRLTVNRRVGEEETS